MTLCAPGRGFWSDRFGCQIRIGGRKNPSLRKQRLSGLDLSVQHANFSVFHFRNGSGAYSVGHNPDYWKCGRSHVVPMSDSAGILARIYLGTA